MAHLQMQKNLCFCCHNVSATSFSFVITYYIFQKQTKWSQRPATSFSIIHDAPVVQDVQNASFEPVIAAQ